MKLVELQAQPLHVGPRRKDKRWADVAINNNQ